MQLTDTHLRKIRVHRRFVSSALTSVMIIFVVRVAHRFDLLDDWPFYISCGATLGCIVVLLLTYFK